ncbi:MAG: thioesterase family protein [Burkholderiales bacterium]|nr:thioesterase family protein [Burkholderiales bacterium]
MPVNTPVAPVPGSLQVQPWDGHDLQALLRLDTLAPGMYRTRHADANLNLRSYGGQSLGQALMAACMDVQADRRPSAMQFMFLQGADPAQPIALDVTRLQDGRRFSSRHVRGAQAGGRLVLDAQVSFAVELDSPAHQRPWSGCGPGEVPVAPAHGVGDEEPPTLSPDWARSMRRLGGYSIAVKPSVVFVLPEPERQVDPRTAEPRLRFWLRARQRLADDACVHAAAFAYLSDWWINFCSLAPHMRDLERGERLYVASLNHAIWLHRPFRADEWLYFDTHSPFAGGGRGLSIAHVHDAAGQAVATVTQECLMVPIPDDGPAQA